MPGLNFLRLYPFLLADIPEPNSSSRSARQCGYERECTEALYGGEKQLGSRESVSEQVQRAIRYGLIPAEDS